LLPIEELIMLLSGVALFREISVHCQLWILRLDGNWFIFSRQKNWWSYVLASQV